MFGGAEHAVLYAPTRTGKGVGVVIPNLLTWPDSVVVLDVKRENWEATAGFRAAHGQQTLLFDPLDPEGRTARYNPLGHIDRADPIAVLDELQRIAAMLFPHPPAAALEIVRARLEAGVRERRLDVARRGLEVGVPLARGERVDVQPQAQR